MRAPLSCAATASAIVGTRWWRRRSRWSARRRRQRRSASRDGHPWRSRRRCGTRRFWRWYGTPRFWRRRGWSRWPRVAFPSRHRRSRCRRRCDAGRLSGVPGRWRRRWNGAAGEARPWHGLPIRLRRLTLGGRVGSPDRLIRVSLIRGRRLGKRTRSRQRGRLRQRLPEPRVTTRLTNSRIRAVHRG